MSCIKKSATVNALSSVERGESQHLKIWFGKKLIWDIYFSCRLSTFLLVLVLTGVALLFRMALFDVAV